jgi:type VI secretion system (T6SS) phospholipase Tle1-like effector
MIVSMYKCSSTIGLKSRFVGHRDVKIDFLGCFDTVATLGIPRSGVLSPLKALPWKSRFDFHELDPMESKSSSIISTQYHPLTYTES